MTVRAPSSDGVHVEVLHGHDEVPHGTRKGYLTGFALSVVLTAIPFILVMGRFITDTNVTSLVIMAMAAAQIVVHMIYFLHLNTHAEGGWTMMAAIFTIVLVVIVLSGSLWVLYHLNSNMMPMSPAEMRTMP